MNERISNSQLFQLIMANIKELIREPGVLFWGIIFPILMSLGLGVAFTKKKDVITTIGVVTQTQSFAQSADTIQVLNHFLQVNKAVAEPEAGGIITRRLTIPDDKLGTDH